MYHLPPLLRSFRVWMGWWCACLSLTLSAQTDLSRREIYMEWDDFVEEFVADMALTGEDEAALSETLQRLEELKEAPLNLNRADREALLQLPFLSEQEADSILCYRERHRRYLTLGELQFVSGLTYATRCRLSLFAFAGDTLAKPIPLRRKLADGRFELTTRLDIPLYRRAGNRSYSEEELRENPNRVYLGNGLGNTLRFRYRYRKEVAYGLTLQKDAGEPFGREGNLPYDYTSFYLTYQPAGQRFRLWLGDYKVQWGAGLLLGNAFFLGRRQWLEGGTRLSAELKPHTSTDECRYFRGGAVALTWGNGWQISAFASLRRLDARVENDTVTSFLTDGLHRTRRELERKHNVDCGVVGARLAYSKAGFAWGWGGYLARYGSTVCPTEHAYNRYYLRGKTAAGTSVDWMWKKRRWGWQGEVAADRYLHLSASQTVRFRPWDDVEFSLQQRSLSQRFVSPFAGTVQQGTQPQNELGVLLGTVWKVWKRTEWRAYVDLFRHPRPVYRADKASQGMEAYIEGLRRVGTGTEWKVRYAFKTKQQNVTGYEGLTEYASTHRGRLSMSRVASGFSLYAAVDVAVAAWQTRSPSWGWMASVRSAADVGSTLRLSAFAACFLTDDYASRLYAYEPRLPHTAGFPTYAYHGCRLVGQLAWKPLKYCSFSVNGGLTHYFNRDYISSGTARISAPTKADVQLQCSLFLP